MLLLGGTSFDNVVYRLNLRLLAVKLVNSLTTVTSLLTENALDIPSYRKNLPGRSQFAKITKVPAIPAVEATVGCPAFVSFDDKLEVH